MPTDEFKPLLDRDKAQRAAAQLTELACPLLREIVNKATWVFSLCISDGARIGGENEDLAAMTLYRHMIELVDGVEVLFAASCIDASVPLLRAEFEASLSLDYIFQADYVRRSLCWSCAYLHSRIDGNRWLDPSTDVGAEFASIWQRDIRGARTSHDSRPAVVALESVLSRDEFTPVEAEYQRFKRAKRRRPEWFQLFGGPQERRALARAVDRETQYLVLYKDWSGFSHAADASPYLRSGRAPGQAGFLAVRSAHEMQHRAALAASWMLHASRLMLQHFRPDTALADLAKWYWRDFRPRFERLRTLEVVVVEHDDPER
jgi:hypothetical protein